MIIPYIAGSLIVAYIGAWVTAFVYLMSCADIKQSSAGN